MCRIIHSLENIPAASGAMIRTTHNHRGSLESGRHQDACELCRNITIEFFETYITALFYASLMKRPAPDRAVGM